MEELIENNNTAVRNLSSDTLIKFLGYINAI